VGLAVGLAVGRDLRELRSPAGPDELAAFETDVLAGFVLARASAGLADGTIRSDVGHLEQVRTWLGRPLWDAEARFPGRSVSAVTREYDYFSAVATGTPGCTSPSFANPSLMSSNRSTAMMRHVPKPFLRL